ncbi:MAG: hypothetical protein ACO3VO_08785, partial [Ilumatobacteraceae bacterium]
MRGVDRMTGVVARHVTRLAASLALLASLTACGEVTTTSESGVLEGVGRLPGYDFWAPVTLPDGVELQLPLPEGGPVGGRVT